MLISYGYPADYVQKVMNKAANAEIGESIDITDGKPVNGSSPTIQKIGNNSYLLNGYGPLTYEQLNAVAFECYHEVRMPQFPEEIKAIFTQGVYKFPV